MYHHLTLFNIVQLLYEVIITIIINNILKKFLLNIKNIYDNNNNKNNNTLMALAAAFRDLVLHIHPPHLKSPPIPKIDEAILLWLDGHVIPPLSCSASCLHKSWDTRQVTEEVECFLSNVSDDLTRARLLAISALERGFMSPSPPPPPSPHPPPPLPPISNLGLRMDDTNIGIAVGLHLGSSLGHPHQYQYCDTEVVRLGFHSLCGNESEVYHHRNFSGLYNRPRCPPGSKCQVSATQMVSV